MKNMKVNWHIKRKEL